MATKEKSTVFRFGNMTCNCGCRGTDPWHRRSYRRVVTVGSDPTRGTVSLPWTSHPVPVTRTDYVSDTGRIVYGDWWFDPDKIVCDR